MGSGASRQQPEQAVAVRDDAREPGTAEQEALFALLTPRGGSPSLVLGEASRVRIGAMSGPWLRTIGGEVVDAGVADDPVAEALPPEAL